MTGALWRGQWYIYHHVKHEFLRQAARYGNKKPDDPDKLYCRWTPGLKLAQAYKNPSLAQKMAGRLNRELYDSAAAGYPCQPVTVVTGEAARCLDLINRRDGMT